MSQQSQPVPSDESSHPDKTNTGSAAVVREAIPAVEFSAKVGILAVVLLAGVLPWVVAMVAGSLFRGTYVHEPLHECVELVGTCIALVVATLLWLRSQYEKEAPHLMWAAAALVAMGLIDGVHGVAPFGMAWSWLRHGATLVGGLLFSMVWLAQPWLELRRKKIFLAGVALLSLAAASFVWWKPGLFPAPWQAGDYSFAVKAANGLGGLGFLAAAVFFLRRYWSRQRTEDLVLASQTLLFGVAGLLFGYSHIWHAGWWVWHGARLTAYSILLVTAYEVMESAEEELRQLTEAVQSERERLEKQQFYTRSLIEASLDPLVTISREGKITDVNRATETVTGVARERLIRSDFCDYFSEPEKARASYQRVFADGLVQDYPLAIRHTSGRLTEVLYNATVFRNQKGEVEGVFAAARDVTARKRAEQRVAEQQFYTRSLIEASLDPLVTISREGKITDVNRATERASGVVRARLIGSDFSDYFSEPEKARAGYQQVFADGLVQDYPLAIRHTSGRLTDVLYNATVFRNQNGEAEGVFAAARDITAQKQAEQQLKRYAAELERSNAELQDFASIASHDLQEPLRKVLAFGEHLRQHLGSNLDELGSDFLTRMQNAANRMSALIQALLEYSRVTTRAQPFQTVDMTQLVFEVLLDLEDRIATSHARVEFLPMPRVLADPMQVRQLLQNLLGNALKFQPPGRTPQVELKADRKNGWCEISVCDNGIGFDEKYLERIFRPFQRLHGRGEYEGSGMGLAICRKVVARHGGEITAHSRPGEGSTFVVTLPTTPDQAQGSRL